MAETTSETSAKPKAASKPAKVEPPKEETEPTEPEKPAQKPPHIVMRALLGFAGLTLLIGFFLPWLRYPATTGDHPTPEHFQNGLDLLLTHDIEGTPAAVVLVVPILGVALSAASFMGFRYAAQTAIAVSVAMLLYGLYVLGSMFVQSTAYGLWTIAVGTLVTLLLGVITFMIARRGDDDDEDAKVAESKAAAKKS